MAAAAAKRTKTKPKPKLGKKEKAEKTRAEILDAAINLFARQGFAQTSMTDLSRAIHMTQGALYWHFASKEDLLVAAIDELYTRLVTQLRGTAEWARGEGDPLETLDTLIHRVARVVEKQQQLLLFVGIVGAEAMDTNERIEKAVRRGYRQLASFVETLLTRAIAQGRLAKDTDVECTAEMFLGMFMGGILHHRLFRKDFPPPRALPILERLLRASVRS